MANSHGRKRAEPFMTGTAEKKPEQEPEQELNEAFVGKIISKRVRIPMKENFISSTKIMKYRTENFFDISGGVPPGTGNENRTSILPQMAQGDINYKAPNYDYAASVPTPSKIGVVPGNTLESVTKAVSGMAYYSDVIGFGGSSSFLTSDMGLAPLGMNYFMPTSQTCPNGARMWVYMNGIPEGNSLGSLIQNVMAEENLPALKGLAPGMMEDVEAALNPSPLLQAVFGKPYPDCEQQTLPVGDAQGLTRQISGTINYNNGQPVQTQWVQKKDANGNLVFIDSQVYNCVPKTLNPDGSVNPSPPTLDSSCSTSGFSDINMNTYRYQGIAVAVGLFALALAIRLS
jgi:hypothetical protein